MNCQWDNELGPRKCVVCGFEFKHNISGPVYRECVVVTKEPEAPKQKVTKPLAIIPPPQKKCNCGAGEDARREKKLMQYLQQKEKTT